MSRPGIGHFRRSEVADKIPGGDQVAAAQPAGDWGVQRDPFDRTVIARYKAILASNPHDASALAKRSAARKI